jgi:hypothetical protein
LFYYVMFSIVYMNLGNQRLICVVQVANNLTIKFPFQSRQHVNVIEYYLRLRTTSWTISFEIIFHRQPRILSSIPIEIKNYWNFEVMQKIVLSCDSLHEYRQPSAHLCAAGCIQPRDTSKNSSSKAKIVSWYFLS